MTGIHLDPRTSVFAVVASLAFVTLMMGGCSPTEDQPPGDAAGTGLAEVAPGSSAAVPVDDSQNCCSCSAASGKTFTDPQLPCLFDYPASWESMVGGDGGLISAVIGPSSCGTTCPHGEPGIAVSYGRTYDSNADTMLSIWPEVMSTVGSARCGEGTVEFFSTPGSDPTGYIGGVKFYVQVGGKKYGGGATFNCGNPGGWLPLQDMFVDSFRDNPGSTFPEQ